MNPDLGGLEWDDIFDDELAALLGLAPSQPTLLPQDTLAYEAGISTPDQDSSPPSAASGQQHSPSLLSSNTSEERSLPLQHCRQDTPQVIPHQRSRVTGSSAILLQTHPGVGRGGQHPAACRSAQSMSTARVALPSHSMRLPVGKRPAIRAPSGTRSMSKRSGGSSRTRKTSKHTGRATRSVAGRFLNVLRTIPHARTVRSPRQASRCMTSMNRSNSSSCICCS